MSVGRFPRVICKKIFARIISKSFSLHDAALVHACMDEQINWDVIQHGKG